MKFADYSNSRNNNFDFLRLAFASLVLWYHCFPLMLGDAARPIGFGERLASLTAEAAVAGFFIISGFLVTSSWQHNPNIGRYLKNRTLRIYPAFVTCSLLCASVVGPLGSDNVATYWRQFHLVGFTAYMLLLVGPYMPPIFLHLPLPRAVDGSFWTLRYEFECYLLVLFLGLIGIYRSRVGVLILWGTLFAVLTMQVVGHRQMLPNRELHILGNPSKWLPLALDFFAGMTFYLYRGIIPHSRSLFFASVVLMGLACFHSGSWLSLVAAICVPYALFFVAFQNRIRLQNFACLGDFSYGMYLYAFPIQQLLIMYFGANLTPTRLFFAAFPLTLATAVVSWHFVEKPCLRLRRYGVVSIKGAVTRQE